MTMADEEPFEWNKEFSLFWDLHGFIRKGGMTADERTDLAKKFGVSEDLLLRYERATSVYFTTIYDKQRTQARIEAIRLMNKLGKDIMSDEFWDEAGKAYERIEAATPENEITREFKKAKAAIRAALDASTSTPEK